jgi:hypothetical protein
VPTRPIFWQPQRDRALFWRSYHTKVVKFAQPQKLLGNVSALKTDDPTLQQYFQIA